MRTGKHQRGAQNLKCTGTLRPPAEIRLRPPSPRPPLCAGLLEAESIFGMEAALRFRTRPAANHRLVQGELRMAARDSKRRISRLLRAPLFEAILIMKTLPLLVATMLIALSVQASEREHENLRCPNN